MALRRDVHDEIRRIHGDDVEIVEVGGTAPSAPRRAVYVEPPPVSDGMFGWVKALGLLFALIVLAVLLIVGFGGILFGLFGLWTLLWPK